MMQKICVLIMRNSFILVVIYPQDKDVASSNKLLDQEVKVENYKEEFVAQNSNMVFQNFVYLLHRFEWLCRYCNI